MQPLVCVAYAMGLMLSPEILVLLGNTLGQSGPSLLVGGLALALGLHSLTALLYGRWEGSAPVYSGETQILRAAWGPVGATVLPLAARGLFTVCAATGILAIAGYVFNLLGQIPRSLLRLLPWCHGRWHGRRAAYGLSA